jgi:hypothetical protein
MKALRISCPTKTEPDILSGNSGSLPDKDTFLTIACPICRIALQS